MIAWERLFRRALKIVDSVAASGEKTLRKTFSELDTLDFRPSFDECVGIVKDALEKS